MVVSPSKGAGVVVPVVVSVLLLLAPTRLDRDGLLAPSFCMGKLPSFVARLDRTVSIPVRRSSIRSIFLSLFSDQSHPTGTARDDRWRVGAHGTEVLASQRNGNVDILFFGNMNSLSLRLLRGCSCNACFTTCQHVRRVPLRARHAYLVYWPCNSNTVLLGHT